MSATIELAALIVRQCVDEGDRVYGIHPNTLRGMAIAAKNEIDSLRARIAELEAETTRLRNALEEMDGIKRGETC